MKTDPEPGAGDVQLELGSEIVVLKCSPGAILAIARQPGSFHGHGQDPGVVARVWAGDIDMMCLVIRAGLGLTGRALPDLADKVALAGVNDVRQPLVQYLGNLARGGKPLQDEGGDAGDGDPNP